MIKLIVALGNPGREYELTRHNIGWLVADSLPDVDTKTWKSKFKGEYTDIEIKGEKVWILKPQTFMNLSGESVQALCQFFKVTSEEVLVLQDELDLPFGQFAFKKAGGLAGHNGLKSMAQCLGNQEFYRLRIGIGRPVHGNVASWVLSQFSSENDTELEIVLKEGAKAVMFFLRQGMAKAGNRYNKKNFLEIK